MAQPSITIQDIDALISQITTEWTNYKSTLSSTTSSTLPTNAPATSYTFPTSLISSTKALLTSIEDPAEVIREFAYSSAHQAALTVAVDAGFIDAIPSDGGVISAAEIAEKLDVAESLVVRIMRSVVAIGACREVDVGVREEVKGGNSKTGQGNGGSHGPAYTHGRISNFLASSSPARSAIVWSSHTLHAIFPHLNSYLRASNYKVDPFSSHPDASTFTFDRVRLPLSHLIIPHPKREFLYSDAMRIGTIDGVNHKLLSAYQFREKMEEVTRRASGEGDAEYVYEYDIVDVGGGMGELLWELKEVYPEWGFRAMLQDQKEVISMLEAQTPATSTAEDNNNTSTQTRTPFFRSMTHNYYEPQPIRSAAYIFRRIFIDNSDENSRRILRALKPVFSPQETRLLIIERLFPEKGMDARAAGQDIAGLLISGSKGRSRRDMEVLLGSEGFRVTGVWSTEKEGLVEAVLEG